MYKLLTMCGIFFIFVIEKYKGNSDVRMVVYLPPPIRKNLNFGEPLLETSYIYDPLWQDGKFDTHGGWSLMLGFQQESVLFSLKFIIMIYSFPKKC